jgi:hypothetical protein
VIEHSSTRLHWCGTREPGWTYVQFSTGEELLFHDAVDPRQRVNLIDDPLAADDYDRLRTYAVDNCVPTPPGFSW